MTLCRSWIHRNTSIVREGKSAPASGLKRVLGLWDFDVERHDVEEDADNRYEQEKRKVKTKAHCERPARRNSPVLVKPPSALEYLKP